jgi:hypothetical protein
VHLRLAELVHCGAAFQKLGVEMSTSAFIRKAK